MQKIEKTLTFRIGSIIGLINAVILIKLFCGNGDIHGFLTIMPYLLFVYVFCAIIINSVTLILIFLDLILLKLMQKTKVSSNIALRTIKYIGFISYIVLNMPTILIFWCHTN